MLQEVPEKTPTDKLMLVAGTMVLLPALTLLVPIALGCSLLKCNRRNFGFPPAKRRRPFGK